MRLRSILLPSFLILTMAAAHAESRRSSNLSAIETPVNGVYQTTTMTSHGLRIADETATLQRFPHVKSVDEAGDAGLLQAPQRGDHSAIARTYDAMARNVGPTSSATGYPKSNLGSPAGDSDEYLRAPVAGWNGVSGN